MRVVIISLLLLSACAAQKPDPVGEQVQRVETLASAEPPIFGIQTLLRTAEILTPKHPVQARGVLDRAISSLAGIHEPKSYSNLLVIAVRLMAPLNPADAEQLIKRLPVRHSAEIDYKAKAYEALILKNMSQEQVLVDRALAAGAFRLDQAANLLRSQIKSDPAAASGLFARMLSAFPADAGEEDALFLAGLSLQVLNIAPELAINGAEKALRAGWIADADALKSISLHDEDFAERNRKFLNRTPPKNEPLKFGPGIFSDGPFSAAGLSVAQALDLVRQLPEGPQRTGALLRLSRRDDFSELQQGMIAVEAMAASEKMDRTDGDRLMVYSMLARDFSKRGDRRHAERAARLLAESFTAVCRCEDASCDSLEGREDCAEVIESFVEYLEVEGVPVEDLNIQHPSLSARLALRELAKLVGYTK